MAYDVLATLQKLPPECYSTYPANRRQLIGIHRGVPGYTPLRVFDSEEEAAAMVKSLNDDMGVTPEQREAMVNGSMFGWHTPSADPDRYVGPKLKGDGDGQV